MKTFIMFFLTMVGLLGGLWFADAEDEELNVTTEIQKRINLNPRIDSSNIHITYQKNKVVFSGTVDCIAEKQLVEEVAKSVVGGYYNINELKVVPPAVSDSDIKQSIEVSMPVHCLKHLRDFSVQVNDGNVTLSGRTDALHHSTMAEYVAGNTRGVKGVTNNILVSSLKESDRLLRENILSLLSTNLGKKKVVSINVIVLDGKVILKGNVESYDQKKYVLELIVSVPGTVSVQDDLKIAPVSVDHGGMH